MELKEINCIYGSGNTPGTLFVYNGWYCVEGSVNVNRTRDDLNEGVDIELVEDKPIESLKQLERFIDDE